MDVGASGRTYGGCHAHWWTRWDRQERVGATTRTVSTAQTSERRNGPSRVPAPQRTAPEDGKGRVRGEVRVEVHGEVPAEPPLLAAGARFFAMDAEEDAGGARAALWLWLRAGSQCHSAACGAGATGWSRRPFRKLLKFNLNETMTAGDCPGNS